MLGAVDGQWNQDYCKRGGNARRKGEVPPTKKVFREDERDAAVANRDDEQPCAAVADRYDA